MRFRLTLLMVLWPALALANPCPATNIVLFNGFLISTSSDPAGSASTDYPEPPHSAASAGASWNAVAATLAAQVQSSTQMGGSASVSTADDFQVLGLSPGGQVTVIARFVVNGISESTPFYGSFSSGSLSDDAGVTLSQDTTAEGGVVLEMPVVFTAGATRRLTYAVQISGYGAVGSLVDAGLSFPDLPAHLSIVSCRGFQSGAITPARSATWGALKKLYR